MTLVLANGCFDLLHVGHIRHLYEARELGTHLVVGVTTDEHVGKGRGRPIESVEERMEKLRALAFVTAVTPCRNAVEALRHWNPDVFVKGSDHSDDSTLPSDVVSYCRTRGIRIMFTRAPKYSTSELIERIKRCA